MPHEEGLPERPMATLAAFMGIALEKGSSLLLLVPDDEPLPELSNALDLTIRPLCLILPAADFAARIALRATLTLLKSRLWRDGEDEQSETWARQRKRIASNDDLWQEANIWAAKNDRSDFPLSIAELFPVRIMPLAAWRNLQLKTADITLLYRCDAPAQLIKPAGSLMRIGSRADVPRPNSIALADEEARLLIERAQLTRDIADLELELATVQAEVAEFMHQYYKRIGKRMAEVDALQAQLARDEARKVPKNAQTRSKAEKLEQQADESAQESQSYSDAAVDDPPPFHPNKNIKLLFRQIAQKIHPDRAANENDRAWRTNLMSEANRAYRHGDEAALREVAALWNEGRDELSGDDRSSAPGSPAASTVPSAPTLRNQVARLRARFEEIESELHRIFGSHLYELFIAARQARRQRRDLISEMAAQLDASLELLRHRCSAKVTK